MTEITEDEFVLFLKSSTDPLIAQHKVCSQLLLGKRDDLSSSETIYFLESEVSLRVVGDKEEEELEETVKKKEKGPLRSATQTKPRRGSRGKGTETTRTTKAEA